jgi:deoxyribonuclease I
LRFFSFLTIILAVPAPAERRAMPGLASALAAFAAMLVMLSPVELGEGGRQAPPPAQEAVEASHPPYDAFALPETPRAFSTVRRRMYEQVFHGRRETFYCGCSFDEDRVPDLDGCGYEIRRSEARARRVEAEHVIPASWIGRGRPCWEEQICSRDDGSSYGGRACCLAVDDEFRTAHNDLHNLWPAIGEINADRSNFAFALLEGDPGVYGQCDILIDFERRLAQPRPGIRGDIARMALYMERLYGVEIDDEQRELLERWLEEHPPDEWELERHDRIEELQGNRNPYVRPPSPHLESAGAAREAAGGPGRGPALH